MNTVRLSLTGPADRAVKFLEERQQSDSALWRKFVDIYRTQPDSANNGWRGEYWGKMMPAAR